MRHVDLHALIDHAKFQRFHWIVLIWCTLIIIFDGYDLAVAGAALPSIMKEMGVSPTNAGFMMSSALFGMMFGAIFLGTMADKVGRRWTIAICIALFSIFTAAAGLTHEPISFSVMRFLAGLGIGGVLPNVVAHMAEYSPRKIRSTMVTLMFSGYAVGGMLAAVLGKGLIADYGWQAVFFAAAAPLILVPFMMMSLPESATYLIKKGRHADLQKIAHRIEPSYVAQQGDHFALPASDNKDQSVSLGRLFQEGRGFSTIMFWIAFFMCLFMVYALSSWLAKLMANAGYSLGSALTFVLVLNFGAMIGAIGGGWLADRFNIKVVQIVFYALAAISITSLGYKLPLPLLYVMVGLAGASTIGTQIVTYAYVGQFYPYDVRSTGIGWASGVGRAGAILAPIVIGIHGGHGTAAADELPGHRAAGRGGCPGDCLHQPEEVALASGARADRSCACALSCSPEPGCACGRSGREIHTAVPCERGCGLFMACGLFYGVSEWLVWLSGCQLCALPSGAVAGLVHRGSGASKGPACWPFAAFLDAHMSVERG